MKDTFFLGDKEISSTDQPSKGGPVSVTFKDGTVSKMSEEAFNLTSTASKSDASSLRDKKVTAVTAKVLKAALDFDLSFDECKYLQSLISSSLENSFRTAIALKFGREFQDDITLSDVDNALKAKAVPPTKS